MNAPGGGSQGPLASGDNAGPGVSSSALLVHDLTRRFGTHAAVDHVSFTVPAGTTFGFIGPNGAGKTTTLRMLMGTLRRSSGIAAVLGLDPQVDPVGVKQRVGYVPESHHIYRQMRVGQVLDFAGALYTRWNPNRCDELLRLFGLARLQRVKALSKGALAKLALLLALAHEPEVLILDEPMSGLDPLVREEFLEGVLASLCDRPRTMLFSSHVMSDVQRLADTVGILHAGRLIAVAPLSELVGGTKRLRAVLRDGAAPGSPPAGTICQRVQGREWLLTVRDLTAGRLEQFRAQQPVAQLQVEDVGLEEVFKDYIRGERTPA